ncbi:MAG: PAS-domain containing protein, partial [Rhizobiales bacterium]|nr:PAS-domain containing protein [Hyphomicrobiales bacterium]
AEIYGLAPEHIKPGTSLKAILEARVATGVYGSIDGQRFVEDGVATFREKVSTVLRLADGRSIAVLRLPMPDGSLVSTHEDITQREKLNARFAAQHMQLDAVMHNMVQGVAMYDAEQRLIICIRSRWGSCENSRSTVRSPGVRPPPAPPPIPMPIFASSRLPPPTFAPTFAPSPPAPPTLARTSASSSPLDPPTLAFARAFTPFLPPTDAFTSESTRPRVPPTFALTPALMPFDPPTLAPTRAPASPWPPPTVAPTPAVTPPTLTPTPSPRPSCARPCAGTARTAATRTAESLGIDTERDAVNM